MKGRKASKSKTYERPETDERRAQERESANFEKVETAAWCRKCLTV